MAGRMRVVADPMGPPPPDKTVPKPGGEVDRRRFSSVPPTWISGLDRVPDVESALFSLQVGNFRSPALLADAAMRDDRIWSVMDTRLGVLRGADVEVKPADNSAKADEVATVLGGDESKSGIWDDIFPAQTVSDLLQYGWLNAIAVAEIVWVPSDPATGLSWMPRLVPYHPQFIYWDWGYRCYRLILEDGIINLPDVMSNPYSDGKWFVWCPFGYQYAWRKAMIKPLADLYLKRRWNGRDWARYNEKQGSPADIVYVPEDAEDADKTAFFNDVLGRGSDTAVMVPRRDGQSKDDGYGLDILEATARTYQSFDLMQEKIDNSVAILFWGQNLTTEVQKGAGSKAAEKGHQKVADIKTKEDAAIARAFGQQVLPWWAHHNFGKAELAPRARYAVEPPTDEKEEGDGLKALGDGIASLKTASPKVDVDAILDGHGIPMLTDEQVAEEQRLAREAMAQRPVPGGGPPGAPGGGQPGGGPGDPAGGGTPDNGDPGADGGAKKKGPPPPKSGRGDGAGERAAARLKNTPDKVVSRREFAGFRVAIENPAGSIRRWYDEEGNQTGQTFMHHDYGFFEDHLGADEEELDVYLGPDEHAPDVHVVRQMAKPDYKHKDEDKVFLGFSDGAAAKRAYVQHRDDGARAIGAIITIPMDRFRRKLKSRRSANHISASDVRHRGPIVIRNSTGEPVAAASGIALLFVRKQGGKWYVFSEAGKRLSKGYSSKAAAEKRLGEIEYFKKKNARDEMVATLTAAARHVRVVHTKRRRTKLYSDGVADRGRRSAVRAMAASLHRVKSAIAAAHSYDDLKKRLLVEFRAMRPNDLAKVIEKARIMAKAGGMDSAWQQV